ncbi:hypothetical protein G7Y89_g5654 [Cudoniella acicularis]|uniref:Uncharacterized protein n=1 Tax=Cudoniella acicularis TaxID=354080 RepID=A0A8H4RM35_9HELO|nr:hypothetical protein G7Y89_g5654 [Cudoniella acicularis]
MLAWLTEIRLLAGPTLNPNGGIMATGLSLFDAFWRNLVYNRGPSFNYDSPNQTPKTWLAISFAYRYFLKKHQIASQTHPDFVTWALHYRILSSLAASFEEAEWRVQHARGFFVSEEVDAVDTVWIEFVSENWSQLQYKRNITVKSALAAQSSAVVGCSALRGWIRGHHTRQWISQNREILDQVSERGKEIEEESVGELADKEKSEKKLCKLRSHCKNESGVLKTDDGSKALLDMRSGSWKRCKRVVELEMKASPLGG